jgi:cytidylate kinase
LKTNRLDHPLIVELAGPAGAGKTVLSQALSQRDERILVSADLKLRRIEHIPIFIGTAPLLLPVLLRRSPPSRWFTWDEIKAMVYLRGWPRVLKQQASSKPTAIILDHGPVFKLAKLLAFGPERLKSGGFSKWWNEMFKQWASTLDLVIWLDAADTNLVERINTRGQRHAVKGRSEREASVFLARYRACYEQILAKLTAYGRPKLLQFDTSQVSIEQTTDELLNACIYPYQ